MLFRNSMSYLMRAAFFSLTVMAFTVNAQIDSSETIKGDTKMNKEFEILLPPQDENYHLVLERSGVHNGIKVALFRYQPTGDFLLNQQHVSILQNESGDLEGFVRLLPQYKDSNNHISKDEATIIAIDFLKRFAPDLLDNYKINWVDKHTEEIYVDNQKLIVAGMKVKCRNQKDGLYFWVVVAPDKSVIIFERDVEWDFLRVGRKTEKWLHDSWLIKNI
jgi:hypothetical protein